MSEEEESKRLPWWFWLADFVVGGIILGLLGLLAEFDMTGFLVGFVFGGGLLTLFVYIFYRVSGHLPKAYD